MLSVVAARATTIVGVGVASVVLAAGATRAQGLLARNRVEQPAFEVIGRAGAFEVRTYAPKLVAEVEVEGDAETATSAGFRVLANYIFGANVSREEIAMTSPVDRRKTSTKIEMTSPVDRARRGDRWVVTFTMPSKWTKDTLPTPNSPRVRIVEVPAKSFLVDAFSGSPKPSELEKRSGKLRDAALAAGYTIVDPDPVYAQYDPPWTMGFLRRNELQLEIELPAPAPAPLAQP
jgi:hypothetical protein